MKKFIHISSLLPSKISINGETLYHSNLDIVSNKDFYIAFFPTNTDKYMPCAMLTSGNNYPNSIKKIPYKDNHYEIIFNPLPAFNKGNEIIILNKKYNNTIFKVYNSNKTFINITSSTSNFASTTDIIQSINFHSLDGYVIINGVINENKQYLLIFNTKSQKIILENTFKKIEKNKTSIKALKQENSLMGYGTVYEFNFSSKNLNKYNVYLENINSTIPEIIPQLFLECVKYKDFKTAKNFLNNPSITNNHLINFFGEINEIYYNGHSKDINYTILSNNTYKNFTFLVNEGKIIDIEENPLNID